MSKVISIQPFRTRKMIFHIYNAGFCHKGIYEISIFQAFLNFYSFTIVPTKIQQHLSILMLICQDAQTQPQNIFSFMHLFQQNGVEHHSLSQSCSPGAGSDALVQSCKKNAFTTTGASLRWKGGALGTNDVNLLFQCLSQSLRPLHFIQDPLCRPNELPYKGLSDKCCGLPVFCHVWGDNSCYVPNKGCYVLIQSLSCLSKSTAEHLCVFWSLRQILRKKSPHCSAPETQTLNTYN